MSYAQPYNDSGEQRDYWAEVAYELPSENEHKLADEAKFADTDFPDGDYQFAITDISPKLEDKFAKPGQPEKDRRALTFTCVDAEDPEYLGKTLRQYYNVSSHPQSALYPIFKAAAGGYLDPNKQPRLIDLRNAQIRAFVVHKPGKNDPSVIKQQFEAIRPVKEVMEVVPF